jgi:hypothetical protein
MYLLTTCSILTYIYIYFALDVLSIPEYVHLFHNQPDTIDKNITLGLQGRLNEHSIKVAAEDQDSFTCTSHTHDIDAAYIISNHIPCDQPFQFYGYSLKNNNVSKETCILHTDGRHLHKIANFNVGSFGSNNRFRVRSKEKKKNLMYNSNLPILF